MIFKWCQTETLSSGSKTNGGNRAKECGRKKWRERERERKRERERDR